MTKRNVFHCCALAAAVAGFVIAPDFAQAGEAATALDSEALQQHLVRLTEALPLHGGARTASFAVARATPRI